jgi:putative flavoprotein involved in K+ transport
MPERILGTSTWWWLDKLGVLKLSGESLLGHKLKESDSFPARGNRLSDLKEKGVKLVSRLMTVRGKRAEFANHENAEVDVIIWATGYQDETNWVSIPEAKDAKGRFIHHQGISPVPNLYYLGRPWQRNRRSALIAGAGEDALWLKEQILTRLGNR